MLSLVMNPGLPEEQTVAIRMGTMTIGRTKDNDVSCGHKSLSRRHAQLDYDGRRLRLTDLGSKNGVYCGARRVTSCEVADGESFRCGDIRFLVESSTVRSADAPPARTLPSVLAVDTAPGLRAAGIPGPAGPAEEPRFNEKLFALIRATELVASATAESRVLEELVALVVHVIDVERVAIVTVDAASQARTTRAARSFARPVGAPFSSRVVESVIARGTPVSLDDLTDDRTIPGDRADDGAGRAVMCAPLASRGRVSGAFYVDSGRARAFRPDDMALLRAFANLAAIVGGHARE